LVGPDDVAVPYSEGTPPATARAGASVFLHKQDLMSSSAKRVGWIPSAQVTEINSALRKSAHNSPLTPEQWAQFDNPEYRNFTEFLRALNRRLEEILFAN